MRFLITVVVTVTSLLPITATEKVMPEIWEQCARLAQNGDSEAQYRLGRMYRDGEIVGKDAKEAFYWFRKSAANGNDEAMLEVGKCFRDGLGVIADNRIAAENFWRSAEKGNPEGAYCYAVMLRDGIGIPQDRNKAYRWFSKAAEKGYADAATQARHLSAYAGKNKNATVSVNTKISGKGKSGTKQPAGKHGRRPTKNKQKRK